MVYSQYTITEIHVWNHSQPVLQQPPHALPSGTIQLVEEALMSPSVGRICRVVVGGSRAATFLDLFLRDASSRSSKPMLRPPNPPGAAYAAGLNKLKSVFERSSLGASPPCNIVFAWLGTPAQYVEAVCRDGPRAFRTTDGGFFGAGSYFAVELEYATRYAMMQVRTSRSQHNPVCLILRQAPSASGEYPVILFA